jgi:hypothetical protein
MSTITHCIPYNPDCSICNPIRGYRGEEKEAEGIMVGIFTREDVPVTDREVPLEGLLDDFQIAVGNLEYNSVDDDYVAAYTAARTALLKKFEKQEREANDTAYALGRAHSQMASLRLENERLRRFESYVCGQIAMGQQAELTVEALPK